MDELRDPPDEIDPALTRRMETVTRREMEAAERQAVDLAARRRTLVDVAWEAVQSGRAVVVRIGQFEISGLVVYARGDLISVQTTFGMVEVQLGGIDSLQIARSPSGEGRSVPREAESFVARMSLLQLDNEEVEVVCRGALTRFEGRVRSVGRDHIVMDTPHGQVFVSLLAVACVIRRPRP